MAGLLGQAPVVLVRAGMGAERAEAAVHRLVLRDGVARIMVCGFCAGLAPGVAPGDIVVATRVESRAAHLVWVPHAAEASAATARPGGIRVHAGPIVTVEEIARRPAAKRALAAEYPGAIAMDMESDGAAKAASELGIPWVVVRAVTDGLADRFPLDFSRHVDPATGDVRRSAVVRLLFLQPWLIPAIVRLGLRSARAARNLAAFVEVFLSATVASSSPRSR